MRLEEALSLSKVNSAWRPYYIGPADPNWDKQIVSRGNLEDIFVIYADTKKFYMELPEAQWNKVQGMNDWEPVAPIG